jgi:spore coat assembly protein
MNIGDIVVRKKYNKDIVFEIIDIKDNIYYLRGIEFRLIADSELDDLELCELNIKEDHFL